MYDLELLPARSAGRCRRHTATEGSYRTDVVAHDPSVAGYCATSPASPGRNLIRYSAGFATTPPCPCIASASSVRGATFAYLAQAYRTAAMPR
jgi:hypothetical protein